MKLIRKLFIASIILSIGSIAGVSVWADSNDIFTLSNSYSFYWFVAITSLLFSLASYFIHTLKIFIDYTRQSIKLSNLHLYVVTFFGSIYTIFWLGASAGVTSNLRYCLVIKNNFNFNYNCNGQIISTVFGFLNFILWSIICYYSGSYWYYIITTATTATSTTTVNNDIELQSNQETHVSSVSATKELPSIPVTESLPSIPVTESLPSIPITESLLSVSVTESLPSIPVTESLLSVSVTKSLPSIPVTESLLSVSVAESSLDQITFPIISEKK